MKYWLQNMVANGIFRNSPSAIIVADANGNILDWNSSAEETFGHTADEARGHKLHLIIPPRFRDAHNAGMARVANGGKGRVLGKIVELVAIHAEGREFPVEVSLSTYSFGNNKYFSAICRDITDRKLADEARTQFLSNISHDIRTPLSVVTSSARMLSEANLGEGDRARLKRLQQASEVLYSLVNDVLDWSKIEAGEIDLRHDIFSLEDVLGQQINLQQEAATEKGLELRLEASSDLPDYVSGDSRRLQQVVGNLVGNAIKFTNEGKVTVKVDPVTSKDPDRCRLKLEVSDSGIGIASEDLPHLFERFRQVDNDNIGTGSGLGLSIVRQLAELMDGSVEVESELGVGTTFIIELEFDLPGEDALMRIKTSSDAAEVGPSSSLKGTHILLVDDNVLIAEELEETIIEAFGAKVTTCTNGQEAIDWLQQHHDEVDLVLMDIHMPVMDGVSAVKLIREDPNLSGLVVIAMTAGATKTKIAELLDAGMTDYITKPFTEIELQSALIKSKVQYRDA